MKKELKLIIIKVITLLSGMLLVITTVVPFLLKKYFMFKLIKENFGAASVGIIGGADGPTAIFVGTKLNLGSLIGIVILLGLTIIGSIILWRNKK
ncbi:hypothetical protein CS063_09750 [Sporanaerobium hydrogeniformans]|uniref:Uncharacterized protein n=1 Tax=Sporanaerobium hydrogeniformans TaxID=3072179 RepID=A0AC61DBG3_9FIRM|nr:sodium ion-translocating decarboxylase subunit beta [Sporanaerobium hydrogeniformans]PHV70576.1 hypothetical protein CS063_09750 [Sporanaerobium hydrogeniformans]